MGATVHTITAAPHAILSIKMQERLDPGLAVARWLPLPHVQDERGTLTVCESSNLPFRIERVFFVSDVPASGSRGDHAHRYASQILIPSAGRFCVDLSDGNRTASFDLD